MKRKLFFMSMFSLSLMLGACGNKEEKSANDAATKDEPKVEKAEQTNATDEETQPDNQILPIKKVWRDGTIKVDAGTKTPDIRQLSAAFCREYPSYDPCTHLLEYLKDPKGYKNTDENCVITDETKNGYIKSEFPYQYDWLITCCFWKRDNGHRLFAAWLSEGHENPEDDGHMIAFYDYDPETDMLTPETELTDMIEKELKSFGESYNIILPSEGKDIEINAYKFKGEGEEEEELAEEANYKMVWNGQTFKMVKL